MDLLDDIEPKRASSGRNSALIVLYSIAMAAYGIALILMLDEIESILGTGPVVVILGTVILILAIISGRKIGIIHGSVTLGIPFLVFLVIYFFRLSPSEARKIIPFPLLLFLILYVPFTIYCIVRESKIGKV